MRGAVSPPGTGGGRNRGLSRSLSGRMHLRGRPNSGPGSVPRSGVGNQRIDLSGLQARKPSSNRFPPTADVKSVAGASAPRCQSGLTCGHLLGARRPEGRRENPRRTVKTFQSHTAGISFLAERTPTSSARRCRCAGILFTQPRSGGAFRLSPPRITRRRHWKVEPSFLFRRSEGGLRWRMLFWSKLAAAGFFRGRRTRGWHTRCHLGPSDGRTLLGHVSIV